ncbi:MAG: hypothetical protein K1X72_23995 [Pyrinomonadaceae bacterium]|nr:hypothetical protein [Pyrinomonadaceae bacterium]
MAEPLTTESFAKLLNDLSPVKESSAVSYTKLRASLIRFFQIKGDDEPEMAADETLDRVAVKVSNNVQIDDLTKYSFGVARFVFLERLKKTEKERIAVDGFYAEKTRFEIKEETDDYALQRECFENLKAEEKEFLRDYFADLPFEKSIEHREILAAKLDISTNNLRLKIFRLRQRLENCVKNKLK